MNYMIVLGLIVFTLNIKRTSSAWTAMTKKTGGSEILSKLIIRLSELAH